MRYAIILGFAAVPLQWFLLAETPAGDIRLHQLAVTLLTVLIIMRFGIKRLGKGVRQVQLFIGANLYMLILWFALNLFNGLTMVQPLKQVTFMATYIAVTALFYFAVKEEDNTLIDTLRWTATVCVGVLLVAFGYSMLSNGVNPIDVIQRTIESGDPSILQRELFRSSFVGFGYDAEEARGNLRHEVFGGLLFTMYVSSWASARRPLIKPSHCNLYRAAMVVASMFLLISLSRSILVAAAIWPLLSFVRALLTGRVSPRQQLAVVSGISGLAVLTVTGFLEVIWAKFTEDTTSYTHREDLIGLALQRISENFWTGGIDTDRTSAHNFVLDMWQRGGIFVGIPAVFIFLFISVLWLRLLLRTRTIPTELLPLVAAMALPCVRLVTQGGGSLQIVEWVTLAFVMGVLAAIREMEPEESADAEIITAPEPSKAEQAAELLPPTQAAMLNRIRGSSPLR